MCLLSVAWQSEHDYPFIFAGNRDEYHARASAAADWWDDAPDVLGGRDLVAGGSWLGLNRDGRFAVVTNRPDLPAPEQGALSRGDLVSTWLTGEETGSETDSVEQLARNSACYGGFSLLLANVRPGLTQPLLQISGGNGLDELACVTLPPGVSGLSNTAPDAPWPKLQWLNRELDQLIRSTKPDPETIFGLLQRQAAVPDTDQTGVPVTPFVSGSVYGTRCCTVIMVDHDGHCQFIEQRFGPEGRATGESVFEFNLTP
jgi:uncharacterized protein with NRDE domain